MRADEGRTRGRTKGRGTPDFANCERARSGNHFAELKRFSISGQFTTLHHAAMYSGRRF